MADLVIVCWRDIPAQVIARAGRRNAKAELPKRFMEAIDAAAMRAGAKDSDAYLQDWRRAEPSPCGDDLERAVSEAVAALDRAYDPERLRRLVDSGGRETAGA